MDSPFWAKLHGASTHLPIAMIPGACVLDSAAILLRKNALARSMYLAGGYTMVLGALGAVLAVASGIAMTKGAVMGSGALGWHHLFVWPAFGLMVGAATWRILTGGQPGFPRGFRVYFAVEILLVGLTVAAGYWGGEMLMASS